MYRSDLSTAKVFRRNGSKWVALETVGDEQLDYVSAAMDAFGTYAVMAEEQWRVYMPVALR